MRQGSGILLSDGDGMRQGAGRVARRRARGNGSRLLKRILSGLLILVSLFVYYVGNPLKALAEEQEVTENIEEYAEATDFAIGGEEEYSPLVGEISELREERVKQLRRADGAIEAVIYSQPVNYYADGEWHKIDNSLEAEEEDGVTVYKNAANDFEVTFAEDFDSEELVRVASGDNELTWRFLPVSEWSEEAITMAAESGADIEFSQVGMQMSRENADVMPVISLKGQSAEQNEVEIVNAEVTEPETDEERDALLRYPPELTSEIHYTNADGMSVRYILSGKRLVEHITIEERPHKPVAYTVQLQTEGMQVTMEDGEGVLLDENEEPVLRFSKPLVYDAAGEMSEAEGVFLELDGGGYEYMILPDQAWLQESDRAYPVVVDPEFQSTHP
jgi:hypothetical protein